MKYKRMALAACALLLLLSATNLSAVLTDEHPRYHQHLERPAYTPCAEHDGETLCTHLPLVLIDTGGAEIPGVPIRDGDGSRSNDTFTTTADGGTLLRAAISVIDHAAGNNHPDDAPTLQSVIDIRVRGNSSRYFDKHSYLVKTLTDDGAASRDVAMLGMDAFDEWALHGPYLDKTLIRNYMWYNLAGEIMDYAPNVRFCEVLLNGVYQGLYVMTETVSSGADARLKLTEPSKDTVQTSYALRLDRGSGNEVKNIETFSQYALRNLQDMDIVYPGTKWLTPERAAWIAQDFSDFEKSLYSYDYDTEPYAWWEQADMSSFVDYFILNEFTCNYDAGWLSTYIYRDVRGKYKMCIWDFNSACDNYSQGFMNLQRYELQHNIWFIMLSKDEKFINAVIDRYRELRQGILSDEYLCAYIDDVTEWLGDAVERNFSVWGYTLEKDMLSPRVAQPALTRGCRRADEALLHRARRVDGREYRHSSPVQPRIQKQEIQPLSHHTIEKGGRQLEKISHRAHRPDLRLPRLRHRALLPRLVHRPSAGRAGQRFHVHRRAAPLYGPRRGTGGVHRQGREPRRGRPGRVGDRLRHQ